VHGFVVRQAAPVNRRGTIARPRIVLKRGDVADFGSNGDRRARNYPNVAVQVSVAREHLADYISANDTSALY